MRLHTRTAVILIWFSSRGGVRPGALLGSIKARTTLDMVLFAVPCSPLKANSGKGPRPLSAASIKAIVKRIPPRSDSREGAAIDAASSDGNRERPRAIRAANANRDILIASNDSPPMRRHLYHFPARRAQIDIGIAVNPCAPKMHVPAQRVAVKPLALLRWSTHPGWDASLSPFRNVNRRAVPKRGF